MKSELDAFAVNSRNFDTPVSDRFAARDAERRIELDRQTRPTPGAQARRKHALAEKPCVFQRMVALYFEPELLAEVKREAMRRGVNVSAVLREAWAVAKSEIRKMPAKVKP